MSGERRGPLAALMRSCLAFASLFYITAIYLRNKFYDWGWLRQHQAGVPVVVIGNLTVGGTGKTPAVEYVARFYRQHTRHVAILSRGYGVDTNRNDEALVLESNLADVPHLQDADRVALAHRAIEELKSDLLVLDDGLQHRRLKRDLDIVLIDATNPWGFGWCLPRGLLREPRSALRRADAVVITRTDQVPHAQVRLLHEEIRRYVADRPIVECWHAPQYLHNSQRRLAPEKLRCQRVGAFCGIGNPRGFLSTLQDLGSEILDQRILPDHFQYQSADIQALEHWAQSLPADSWLLTTQKDWVKLRRDTLGQRPLWSLRIALEITQGKEALHAALLGVIEQAAFPAASPARAVA